MAGRGQARQPRLEPDLAAQLHKLTRGDKGVGAGVAPGAGEGTRGRGGTLSSPLRGALPGALPVLSAASCSRVALEWLQSTSSRGPHLTPHAGPCPTQCWTIKDSLAGITKRVPPAARAFVVRSAEHAVAQMTHMWQLRPPDLTRPPRHQQQQQQHQASESEDEDEAARWLDPEAEGGQGSGGQDDSTDSSMDGD